MKSSFFIRDLPAPFLALPKKDQAFHICLAGRTVCNDWSLIQSLKSQHQVTIVERIRLLSRNSILETADVLVLDCGASHGLGLRIVPFLKKYHPRLCVVLVDGGLTQRQIAAAFREGARDYFTAPYNLKLLVERIQTLGVQARYKFLENP